MSSLIVTDYSTVESAITVTSPIKSPVDIRDSCCYRQKTGTSVKLLVGRVVHAREQFSLCPCSPLIFEQPRFLCNQQWKHTISFVMYFNFWCCAKKSSSPPKWKCHAPLNLQLEPAEQKEWGLTTWETNHPHHKTPNSPNWKLCSNFGFQ